MERGPHLAPPVSEEVEKHRKVGREIMMLPDEQLEQRRRVGTMIMDLRRHQPISVEPSAEGRVGHGPNARCALLRSSESSAAGTTSTSTSRPAPGGLRTSGLAGTAPRP